MNTYQTAVLTLDNGELRATILTQDSEAVKDHVLKTIFPLTEQGPMIEIYFKDMPYATALEYSTKRMVEVILAISAEMSMAAGKENEQWYELRFRMEGMALMKPNRFARTMTRMLGKDETVGWLNPTIVPDYTDHSGNTWLADLALSDEKVGRELIAKFFGQWGIKEWTLKVKPDGLFPQ